MEELVARVAASGVAPDVAQKAVGIILSFLQKAGPKTDVDELFSSVPGAVEAAAAADEAGVGVVAGLAGAIGGGR